MFSCRFLPHPDTLEVRSSCLTHGTVAINALYVAYYMESTMRDLQQNARAAKRTHSRSVGLDLASATGKEAYPTNYFDSECPEIDPDSAVTSHCAARQPCEPRTARDMADQELNEGSNRAWTPSVGDQNSEIEFDSRPLIPGRVKPR